jgi:hypothetical protein
MKKNKKSILNRPKPEEKKEVVTTSNPFLSAFATGAKTPASKSPMDREEYIKKLKKDIDSSAMKNQNLDEDSKAQKVKRQNEQFAKNLVCKATLANDFTESDSSDDLVQRETMNQQLGHLMVINLSLGALGHFTINCFSKDDPKNIAKTFCKLHKVGPKTKQIILDIVIEKQNAFNGFSIKKLNI